MAQLLSGNASAIKASAKDMHGAEEVPLAYLDTAAELLLRDYATLGTDAIDAYAWLCNVLVDRGGQRYARLLATVAKNAKDEKLRRFAKQKASDRGPGGSFAPGAGSIEAQNAKYPPLYPQITLVRGQL